MAMEIHGIKLVGSIQDTRVHGVATDPTYTEAGHVWFNTEEKKFKMTILDENGAVVVRSFATAEALQSEINTIAGDATTYTDLGKVEDAIQKINGASDVEGSFAKAVKDAKDAVLGTKADGTVSAETISSLDELITKINGSDEVDGSFRKAIKDVVGAAPEALDTLAEIAAYIEQNDEGESNIVSAIEQAITDAVTSAKDELKGSVSEAFDTLEEVETAINKLNGAADAEGSVAKAVKTAKDEIIGTDSEGNATAKSLSQVAEDLAALEESASGATGDTADLKTTVKTDLVAAINENFDSIATLEGDATVEGSVAKQIKTAKEALLGDAAEAYNTLGKIEDKIETINGSETTEGSFKKAVKDLKDDVNATKFAVTTTEAATAHVIQHNLDSQNVFFMVWVDRGDGVYRNDQVEVKIVDNNSIRVGDFGSARNVKVVVQTADSIA